MKMRGSKMIWHFLRFIVNGIIILAVLTALTSLILLLFGIRSYIVLTGSMEPQIPVGSICLVDQSYDFQDIKCGDIITFRTSEKMVVTHRVVSVQESSLCTKGDANNTEDEKAVTAESFIGKCILTLPGSGYVVRFVRSLHGIVIISIFIVLIILADSILDKYKPHE